MTVDNDPSTSESSAGAGNATGGGPQTEEQVERLEIGDQKVALTPKGQRAFEVARTRGVGGDLSPQDVQALRKAAAAARRIAELRRGQ